MLGDKLRKRRLKMDNYECQLSKLFGISEISGKPCSEDLQQHHITYKHCGHESIKDIITVCLRCHDYLTDLIRRERYAMKPPIEDKITTGVSPKNESFNDISRTRRFRCIKRLDLKQ